LTDRVKAVLYSRLLGSGLHSRSILLGLGVLPQ
jgi:hypothetical protein